MEDKIILGPILRLCSTLFVNYMYLDDRNECEFCLFLDYLINIAYRYEADGQVNTTSKRASSCNVSTQVFISSPLCQKMLHVNPYEYGNGTKASTAKIRNLRQYLRPCRFMIMGLTKKSCLE